MGGNVGLGGGRWAWLTERSGFLLALFLSSFIVRNLFSLLLHGVVVVGVLIVVLDEAGCESGDVVDFGNAS